MTQSESVKAIAGATGKSVKEVKVFMAAVAVLAERTVARQGELILPGLGKLVSQKRAARMARNPATGEQIRVPAKKVVKFRVAKALRDAVAAPPSKAGRA